MPHGTSAAIEYTLEVGARKQVARKVRFDRTTQSWPLQPGRPPKPGLVIYAQVDGGYSVWDPARNYWKASESASTGLRPAAYQFENDQLWNGLRDGSRTLCNGLIADWAGWQKEKSEQFGQLGRVLATLSPTEDEPLKAGELTRVSLDDVRDIPTIRMPYGQDVPVVHCSAGIRRILALAYLLVWTWQEHVKASRLLRQRPAGRIILLIDEIECHLHPQWQRRIFSAVLRVMDSLLESSRVDVQVISATHSPLILSSLEPVFEEGRDRLFELELTEGRAGSRVELKAGVWRKRGDVNNWLTSRIFQLGKASSIETERAVEAAAGLLTKLTVKGAEWKRAEEALREHLSDSDSFWTRWNYVAEKRGFSK